MFAFIEIDGARLLIIVAATARRWLQRRTAHLLILYEHCIIDIEYLPIYVNSVRKQQTYTDINYIRT